MYYNNSALYDMRICTIDRRLQSAHVTVIRRVRARPLRFNTYSVQSDYPCCNKAVMNEIYADLAVEVIHVESIGVGVIRRADRG